MQYKIVFEKSPGDLEKSVQQFLNGGWVLLGGPSVSAIGYGRQRYQQAMFKSDNWVKSMEQLESLAGRSDSFLLRYQRPLTGRPAGWVAEFNVDMHSRTSSGSSYQQAIEKMLELVDKIGSVAGPTFKD